MISPLVSNSDPIEFNGLLDLQLKKKNNIVSNWVTLRQEKQYVN